MSKPKVVVRLAGGLGNQLFQWACGFALSKRIDGTLVLDTVSGFATDFKYGRFFELDSLDLKYRRARPYEVASMYARWLLYLVRLLPARVRTSFYYEVDNSYIDAIVRHPNENDAWLIGYFQSPKYFLDCAELVRSNLLLKEPTYWVYRDLGLKMRTSNSVALGIRLYEETKDPSYHAHQGQTITLNKVQSAIDTMTKELGTFDMYIFCTYHADLLDQLKVPGSVKFISADDGYSDTWSSMWLLAQCRHHILSNSSFYWWGAFLSEHYHQGRTQVIMASDNFSNQSIYLDSWIRY